jgi:hypothetical protein
MHIYRSILSVVCALGMLSVTVLAQQPTWVWTGAVTANGAVVHSGWSHDAEPGKLYLRSEADQTPHAISPTEIRDTGTLGKLAVYRLTELQTASLYQVSWSETEEFEEQARFRTFAEGQASFSFAFGACSETGSEHPVFAEILEQKPDFFIHTGDLHYEDIRENDPAYFFEAYRKVLNSAAQNPFFRRLPVIYMWDDHDYGPNDSHRHSPSREASLASYRKVVPHFPLVLDDTGDEPIAQAFSYGRVRFIMTDLRSARDANRMEDGPDKTMMGLAQREWFLQELLEARDSHALIVWVSSVPWIARPETQWTVDHWAAAGYERQLISDFMVEHNISNICIISGDAHMVAADDGRNNRYASDGVGPGFPVYQAAALDRRGSFKGGPYSEGGYPGGGQFGLVRIDDDGARIRVLFEGRNHLGEVIVQHAFTRSVEPR